MRNSSKKNNYYDLFGVPPTADTTSLKEAYHRLARQYHPDLNPENPDAEARFKEIQGAFEVLSDPAKRRAYDCELGIPPSALTPPAAVGNSPAQREDKRKRTSNLFFKGNAGLQEQKYFEEVAIGPQEALDGTEREMRLKLNASCPACLGRGYEQGSKVSVCDTCGGAGMRNFSRGQMPFSASCRHCLGTGRIIEKPCKECKGNMGILKERSVKIKVPAGTKNGDEIKMLFKVTIGGKKLVDRLIVRVAVSEL